MAFASSALSISLSKPPPNIVSNKGAHIASKPALTLDVPTLRSHLGRLCREGRPHLARQLFDTIPRPTTILYNTVIIGFICNNLPLQALLFYAQIKQSASPHTHLDSYTYSSALKACARTHNLMMGKAIHCHFLRCLMYPSKVVYNSLLSMYSTCISDDFDFSKYDLVRKVFDTIREKDVVSWNTIVSWYVKTERYLEAIRLFKLMLKTGVKPSPVSFVGVFPAFSGIKDHDNANVVYGMVLKRGSEFMTDPFVVSSAIFMFAELGCLNLARQVFNHCTEKNAEIWNTMISGYLQNNFPLEGIDLFLQAVETEQILLDDVTLLLALAAASQLQCLHLAWQLHAFVIKNLAVLPVRILNAIIALYSRCSSVRTSFNVFEKTTERDAVSWNTMVSAFVHNGMYDEGLMLVYEMQKQGFAIDSVTVTALLSVASNLRKQEIGKQTHAYLLRHGIRFECMDSYLMEMYAKSGSIQISQRIFDSCMANREQTTWNAMISGYTRCGLVEEAFLTFRKLIEQHVILDAVTLASILPACNPFGSIELGRQLHGVSIRRLLDQNVFVCSALVDMYSKSGSISYAETVFMKSPEKNAVTYTTMILAYGQHGKGEKALSLFCSMQKCGIKPDAITFVAILSACSHAGLIDEGLQIFRSMVLDFKIQPTTEHHCCVADMLGRVGRVVEAFEFLNQLGDEGNVLEIWGSLLASCRVHGHIELGELIGKKLLEMDMFGSLAGYHVLLSNIYADERNWEKVDIVRKDMREKGLQKEVGCSWIGLGGCVTRFVSKDVDHPQIDKIHAMLMILTMETKDTICTACPIP